MVVGNGLIAKKFIAYNNRADIIIFASGISNSKNIEQAAYDREIALLENTIQKYPNSQLVYFSTCSILDEEENKSAYVAHKKRIESVIIANQANYYIFRISNLAGKTNNENTILNFFIHKITSHNHFSVWKNAVRNIIDVDDMYKIIDYIIDNTLFPNSIINIANPISYLAPDIVATIEAIFNKKGNFTIQEKGTSFKIDINPIAAIINKVGVVFGEDYLKNTILKYYSTNDL
jgi:UDP-2-acetamido-2,6-beta-L-arabino-hexul-4-ose reductase